jgi:hypothetical protein
LALSLLVFFLSAKNLALIFWPSHGHARVKKALQYNVVDGWSIDGSRTDKKKTTNSNFQGLGHFLGTSQPSSSVLEASLNPSMELQNFAPPPFFGF